jgi:hypothetical protein
MSMNLKAVHGVIQVAMNGYGPCSTRKKGTGLFSRRMAATISAVEKAGLNGLNEGQLSNTRKFRT